MRKVPRPLGLTIIVAVAAVAMLLVQSMVLGQDQPAFQSAAQEAEVAPARLVAGWEAGVQESVQVVHQTAAFSTNSTSFVDLPNATLSVVFPPGHEGNADLLIVRFFAESVCPVVDVRIIVRCELCLVVSKATQPLEMSSRLTARIMMRTVLFLGRRTPWSVHAVCRRCSESCR